MRYDTYSGGKLVARLDDQTGKATTYNADGTVATTRNLTAEETAQFAAAAAANTAFSNAESLRQKAGQALTTNAAHLALASPSTAQNTAQVKALTRQVNALIRLQIDQTDDISGT